MIIKAQVKDFGELISTQRDPELAEKLVAMVCENFKPLVVMYDFRPNMELAIADYYERLTTEILDHLEAPGVNDE